MRIIGEEHTIDSIKLWDSIKFFIGINQKRSNQFYSTWKPDGIIIYRAMYILHDATRVS